MRYKCTSPAGTIGSPHPLGEKEQNKQGEARVKPLRSSLSRMYQLETHDCYYGPYPSQSTRNGLLRPVWQTSRVRWIMCLIDDSDWIVNHWTQFGL